MPAREQLLQLVHCSLWVLCPDPTCGAQLCQMCSQFLGNLFCLGELCLLQSRRRRIFNSSLFFSTKSRTNHPKALHQIRSRLCRIIEKTQQKVWCCPLSRGGAVTEGNTTDMATRSWWSVWTITCSIHTWALYHGADGWSQGNDCTNFQYGDPVWQGC